MPGGFLVTGGAGFIGSHLVDRLVEAGEQVSVVDDLSRGRRTWLRPEARLLEAHIHDADALRRAVAEVEPDTVVHLAAMHFIPAVDEAPDLARRVNVDGTAVLLDALSPQPPAVFLFASTAAVYPDRRGPIPESCPPAPVDLYGRTKLEGEHLVAAFGSSTGSRCVVARIFNVIGRRETNPHVVPELVAQLREDEATVRLGNLDPRRDYTDVRDVAAALHALSTTPGDGPLTCNVGSGRSVSVAELVEVCEGVLGHPIRIESGPSRRRAQDRLELVADRRLLEETTGWTPRLSLGETLADLLEERAG